jgi:hypothetical protein
MYDYKGNVIIHSFVTVFLLYLLIDLKINFVTVTKCYLNISAQLDLSVVLLDVQWMVFRVEKSGMCKSR